MSAALDTQSIQTRSSRWCKNTGRTASGKVIMLRFSTVKTVPYYHWGTMYNTTKNDIYASIGLNHLSVSTFQHQST